MRQIADASGVPLARSQALQAEMAGASARQQQQLQLVQQDLSRQVRSLGSQVLDLRQHQDQIAFGMQEEVRGQLLDLKQEFISMMQSAREQTGAQISAGALQDRSQLSLQAQAMPLQPSPPRSPPPADGPRSLQEQRQLQQPPPPPPPPRAPPRSPLPGLQDLRQEVRGQLREVQQDFSGQLQDLRQDFGGQLQALRQQQVSSSG